MEAEAEAEAEGHYPNDNISKTKKAYRRRRRTVSEPAAPLFNGCLALPAVVVVLLRANDVIWFHRPPSVGPRSSPPSPPPSPAWSAGRRSPPARRPRRGRGLGAQAGGGFGAAADAVRPAAMGSPASRCW